MVSWRICAARCERDTEVASGQLQQCQKGNQPRAPTCCPCPASTQTQRSAHFLIEAGWHRCNFMFRALNYAPPGIVVIFIAWPYYTYTFINCKILLEDDVGSAPHVSRVLTCLRTADPWTILRLRVPHSHTHLHVLPDLEFRPVHHGRSWSSPRMGDYTRCPVRTSSVGAVREARDGTSGHAHSRKVFRHQYRR